VDLQMKDVRNRLVEHGLQIELTQAAKQWLAEQGFDKDFGARPLKRALQRYVESPLSVRLLQGTFVQGDCVLVDVAGNELTFTKQEEPFIIEQPVEEESLLAG
jgi:ATP-dependent Clp protease ATP-binding subunit ClpC